MFIRDPRRSAPCLHKTLPLPNDYAFHGTPVDPQQSLLALVLDARMATPSRGHKRVRFSDQPQIVEFEPARPGEDDAVEELEGVLAPWEDDRAQAVDSYPCPGRWDGFPGGRCGSLPTCLQRPTPPGAGEINAVRLDSLDPSMAAIQRAKRRKDALLRTFEEESDTGPENGEADYDQVPLSSR